MRNSSHIIDLSPWGGFINECDVRATQTSHHGQTWPRVPYGEEKILSRDIEAMSFSAKIESSCILQDSRGCRIPLPGRMQNPAFWDDLIRWVQCCLRCIKCSEQSPWTHSPPPPPPPQDDWHRHEKQWNLDYDARDLVSDAETLSAVE